MALASGTRCRLVYAPEITRGVTPDTPLAMDILRTVGRNINHIINNFESAEVRQDRQISDLRHGFNSGEGSPQFELSLAAYDAMLEGCLGGTWSSGTSVDPVGNDGVDFTRATGSFSADGFAANDMVRSAGFTTPGNNGVFRVTAAGTTTLTTTGSFSTEAAGAGKSITRIGVANIAAVASGAKFTRSAGSFIDDGFRVGEVVTTVGFTTGGNNVTAVAVSVSATELAVVGVTLIDEAADVSQYIIRDGARLDSGTTLRTFTFERQFLDIVQYQPFRGTTINSLNLSINPEAIIGGNLGLMSMSAGAMSGTSAGTSYNAAPTYRPFAAFQAVLYEGGALQSVVTGLEINIENGRTLEPVVGSKYSPDVFEGRCRVTGTLTAFFENATLFNKFVNETPSSLWVKLLDPEGNFMNIIVPRIIYTGGTIDPPQEGAVPISMPFTGILDPVSLTSISFQRSNV